MPPVVNSFDIKEKIIETDNPLDFQWEQVFSRILDKVCTQSQYLIKLNLIKTTKDKLYFNAVTVEGLKGLITNPFDLRIPITDNRIPITDKQLTCLIIPTGIGAAFGGYAGDANPLAKAFSKNNRYLLTHPNVVNGAVLSDPPANLIYLEGFLLDQFLLGKVNIIPKSKNKIGVIFDKSISEERLDYEVNVLNALSVFYGCEIIGWTLTDKPVGALPYINEHGFSSGKIQNLDSIIKKAEKLKELGATAIAICCAIPDLDLNNEYVLGTGIDPIGGIESLISRVVSAKTGLVSAHAPVLVSEEKVDCKKISPLSAAEYIALTFLPSVISGLRFAPEITLEKNKNTISTADVLDIVLPYNAFGSPGVLYSNQIFNNVVLVRENNTSLKTDPRHLNIDIQTTNKYLDLINSSALEKSAVTSNILNRPVKKIPMV